MVVTRSYLDISVDLFILFIYLFIEYLYRPYISDKFFFSFTNDTKT